MNMRYFFIFLATLVASPVFAETVIAAHISVEPSSSEQITKKLGSLSNIMPEDLKKISDIEIFLLDTENTLQPVILIKGASEAPKSLGTFFKFYPNSGWLVGTSNNKPLPEDTFQDLVKTLPAAASYPVLINLTPPVIIDVLRKDPEFDKKIAGTPFQAVLDELRDIDSIEIRAIDNVTAVRVVLLTKTRNGSALNTLLSQRLPTEFPVEHNRLGTTGALFYGYNLYNPQACAIYLEHISQKFADSLPAFSKDLELFASKLSLAGGYSAFIMNEGDSMPRTFFLGRWTQTSAPDFIKTQTNIIYDQLKSFSPGFKEAPTLKDAFFLGESPVWKLSFQAPGNQTIKPESSKHTEPEETTLGFFALRNGSLLSAPSAESITSFLQNLDSPQSTDTLDKAFTPYPTLYMQAKLDGDNLLKSLSRGAYVPSVRSGSLYMAASIGQGQGAITFDIPYRLFANMQAFMDQQREADKKSMELEKQPEAPASK